MYDTIVLNGSSVFFKFNLEAKEIDTLTFQVDATFLSLFFKLGISLFMSSKPIDTDGLDLPEGWELLVKGNNALYISDQNQFRLIIKFVSDTRDFTPINRYNEVFPIGLIQILKKFLFENEEGIIHDLLIDGIGATLNSNSTIDILISLRIWGEGKIKQEAKEQLEYSISQDYTSLVSPNCYGVKSDASGTANINYPLLPIQINFSGIEGDTPDSVQLVCKDYLINRCLLPQSIDNSKCIVWLDTELTKPSDSKIGWILMNTQQGGGVYRTSAPDGLVNPVVINSNSVELEMLQDDTPFLIYKEISSFVMPVENRLGQLITNTAASAEGNAVILAGSDRILKRNIVILKRELVLLNYLIDAINKNKLYKYIIEKSGNQEQRKIYVEFNRPWTASNASIKEVFLSLLLIAYISKLKSGKNVIDGLSISNLQELLDLFYRQVPDNEILLDTQILTAMFSPTLQDIVNTVVENNPVGVELGNNAVEVLVDYGWILLSGGLSLKAPSPFSINILNVVWGEADHLSGIKRDFLISSAIYKSLSDCIYNTSRGDSCLSDEELSLALSAILGDLEAANLIVPSINNKFSETVEKLLTLPNSERRGLEEFRSSIMRISSDVFKVSHNNWGFGGAKFSVVDKQMKYLYFVR